MDAAYQVLHQYKSSSFKVVCTLSDFDGDSIDGLFAMYVHIYIITLLFTGKLAIKWEVKRMVRANAPAPKVSG